MTDEEKLLKLIDDSKIFLIPGEFTLVRRKKLIKNIIEYFNKKNKK